MPELPTGTATFLFSDIEGSTRLLQAGPDAWPALLERHRVLIREAIAAHGGTEVGTEGDSFFVAFPSTMGALAAAIAAQRALTSEPWPAGSDVRVRMGLHAGAAQLGTDTYVGLDVHRAARIAAVAHGGQLVVSDTVRVLVAQELPPDVTLRDLGEHRLKDLAEPEHLFQVLADGLETEFPPLATLDGVLNNLPRRLTTFLGREREIGEVLGLLDGSRLLTLTGPGGTGKTRLSLEVAARSLDRYADGVFFVELSPVTEAEMVAATIAQALGLPDRGGRTAMERLVEHLAARSVLLVIDNFEQVIEAAPTVAELLAANPNLTVVATSRAALHVYGEREYPVPPLGLPDLTRLPQLEALRQYEAVALFVERATAVRPDFAVTNDNAPAVAEICVRLDGLPLAIELAAARIRILTPQAMLARLENRLGLLSAGSRDLPERQQTLRGAIDWSHDLLDEPGRALFACLATFVGSAGIEAIERVCASDAGGEVLDNLASLVDKSLVRQHEGVGGEPRFSMLETIREYAAEQAAARGLLAGLRERHAQVFGDLAHEASGLVMGSDKRTWLDRLEEEHGNLRAALGFLLETGSAGAALRMVAALWRFWQMRGYLAEGAERVMAALATSGADEHPEARADALSALAGLRYWEGDAEASRTAYLEELELRTRIGDRRGYAEAAYGISFTWSIRAAAVETNAVEASTRIRDARAIFRELGDELAVGRCEWALANVNYGSGDIAEARRHSLAALALFEAAQDQFMVGWATYTLALGELADDHQSSGGLPESLASARTRLKVALRIFAEAQDISGYTLVLDALALAAQRSGDRSGAAVLSGAVRRLERETGTGLNLWNRFTLGFDPEELRLDTALAADWSAGEALTTDEAVSLGLAE
ncbi:MAG: adenylate/guanylate cyclase domain-containing protein [Chloroflexota bacterium]